jgi:hypothetical protein
LVCGELKNTIGRKEAQRGGAATKSEGKELPQKAQKAQKNRCRIGSAPYVLSEPFAAK